MLSQVLRIMLHLHDETGGGTSIESPANGSQESEATVVYGKVTAPVQDPASFTPAPAPEQTQPAPNVISPEARRKAYDEFREQNKDLFEADLQQHLGRRLKGKTAETRQLMEVLNPLMAFMGLNDLKQMQEYVKSDILPGVQDSDTYKKLSEAMAKLGDGGALEAPEATGLSQADLATQGLALNQKLQKMGSSFDLATEMQNETFSGLTGKGVDVESAYKVVHFDEILLRETTQAAEKQRAATIEAIRTKGLSAMTENAAKPAPKVIHKSDPSTLTDKEMDDIVRRVQKGESIAW